MTGEATSREVERQLACIREGAEQILGEEELRARLAEAVRGGAPLRVKLGVDPSAPDLHLGHTVVLNKLRRFQELGHVPIFLIGDFTARIGDPSGKKKTRPALDPGTVKRNAATYLEQVKLILDLQRAEIRFNGEWMDAMTSSDLVRLCSHYTVARILERDDFAKRYAAGEPIAVHEFLYPFVQAYDSVALRADVELGGSDQRFNLLMAREIQRSYGQPPQAVVVHPLLVGTDGRDKMSKSLGNTVGITDPPEDMYGKTMRISDPLMLDWVALLAAGEWDDLQEERSRVVRAEGDPLALKQELARRLVARFHGEASAEQAAARFRRTVQERALPEELPEVRIPLGPEGWLRIAKVMEAARLVASGTEARHLVASGGVYLDGRRIQDLGTQVGPGSYVLQVGRRKFARIHLISRG